MNTIEAQEELGLSRAPNRVLVPIELIRLKKSAAAAICLACDTSGLEDKEIFLALGIDKGYFSNIKSGKATLQGDLIKEFCRIVGNKIYPEWLAFQLGCTLVEIKSEAERRADELQQQLGEERLKNKVLIEALHGRAA